MHLSILQLQEAVAEKLILLEENNADAEASREAVLRLILDAASGKEKGRSVSEGRSIGTPTSPSLRGLASKAFRTAIESATENFRKHAATAKEIVDFLYTIDNAFPENDTLEQLTSVVRNEMFITSNNCEDDWGINCHLACSVNSDNLERDKEKLDKLILVTSLLFSGWEDIVSNAVIPFISVG